ncbi:MAG: hypothetical protein Q4A52_07325 [Bacillota bacterium]|nr:hypothetical protein [Bacillota bacterium]
MKPVRTRRGLSIVEILISAAMIALVAVVLIRLFVSSDSLNRRSRDLDRAVFDSIRIFEAIGPQQIGAYDRVSQDLRVFFSLPGVDELLEGAVITTSSEEPSGPYANHPGWLPLVETAVVQRDGRTLTMRLTDFGAGVRIALRFEHGGKTYYEIETERYRR